jgi:cell division protein FtsL
MIKFFRHIRKRLLSENRLGKYILYAVGEIFLVVIGILIALQINIWNEERKELAIEVKILKEMKLALEDDIKNLQINERSYRNVKRSLEIIKEQLPLETPTNDSLEYAFSTFLFNNSVSPNIVAYETLKAKGIDLISNDSLRKQIIEVYEIGYKYYQDRAKDQFLSETFIQEYCATLFNKLDHFFRKGTNETMVPNNYKALQKDTLYKTIINTRLAQVNLALSDLGFNSENVRTLGSSITTELKRLDE